MEVVMTRSTLAGLLLLALLGAPPCARAHDEAAPPKKLGTVAFANSCAPQAQESFERGVALLHSFAFVAGEQAFREALDRDPACAIATWGIATIRVGNTFAPTGASPEDAQRALEVIDRGRAIGAKTERERAYVEAIAAYYDHFAERLQRARIQALADAFEALANRYGDDDEAQIFSALYLTASQSPADKSYAGALKAAAILEAQFARHPDHPGVAHYLIHSYDYPPIAQKGLPAALCYADIAPDASHAHHMPSHIFTRVGAWRESIDTNARSIAAAKAENNGGSVLHAMDYTVYADLQLARDSDADAIVREARSISTPAVVSVYARAAIPARYAVERDQWAEAAALSDPPDSKFPYTEAMTLFARAVGAARSGNPGAAEKDVVRLAAIAAALDAAKIGPARLRCNVSALPPGSPLLRAGATRPWASCARPQTGKMPARRAPYPLVASCRRVNFSATCCSKAAAPTMHLPPMKPLWSPIRSGCAVSTAPARLQPRATTPTRRATTSAAWSTWPRPTARVRKSPRRARTSPPNNRS
jgi:hypothetical protein